MSNASLMQSIPAKLFQPSNVGIYISLGIHAVLGLALPSMAIFQPKAKPTQRTVSLLELTPTEQARLPESSPPLLNVPAFPNTPLGNFPVFNRPNPDYQSLFPSLPSLPNSSALLPSLPQTGDKSDQVTSRYPDLPTFKLPSRDQIVLAPQRGNLNNRVNNNREALNDNLSLLPPPPQGSTPPQAIDQSSQQFPTYPIPRQSPTDLLRDPPTNPNIPPGELLPKDRSRLRNIPSLPSLVPPINPDELQQQDTQIATGNQNLHSDNGDPSSNLSAAEIEQLRRQRFWNDIYARENSITRNSANTTDEEARKNYVSWVNQVREIQPIAQTITGNYPKDACIKKLSGTAIYGISVNAEGKAANFELIKSSGYPIFNQQAIADIQGKTFEASKPYRIDVKYNYDPKICPSLSMPETETEANTDRQKPEPVTTPATANQNPENTTETNRTNQNNTTSSGETNKPSQSSPSPISTPSNQATPKPTPTPETPANTGTASDLLPQNSNTVEPQRQETQPPVATPPENSELHIEKQKPSNQPLETSEETSENAPAQ